jgi:biotin carboxyl carrier protein
MKRYRITLDDRTFDVQILDDPRQREVRVEVNGERLTVGVEPVASAAEAVGPQMPSPDEAPSARRPTGGRLPPSTGAVIAPLPGVVKSIAVQPGQTVARGDTLLTIEAMKMDNVIRAPREGTVDAVHVTEGRQVAYGDPLLALKARGGT